MANPTTAFGWVMPNSADLVTDLPADFNVFGQGVDTSMAQLLGGTTGQVLSKTSATNMAFTWIANDVGDITGVTAGTGISGGGTSGDVTVTNSMATAITTAGDLIKGTGSGTFDRLGIGSTGQVLTVAAGIPSWATPAAGAGMTFINATTFSASSGVNVDSVFSATYDSYQIILSNTGSALDDLAMQFRTSGTTNTATQYYTQEIQADATTLNASRQGPVTTGIRIGKNNIVRCMSTIFLQNPFATLPTGAQALIVNNIEGFPNLRYHGGNFALTTSFDGFRLLPNSGTITGTVTTFGMAKS